VRVTRRQRQLTADKLWDLANYAMAGLVFGSLLAGLEYLRLDVAFVGLGLYFLLSFIAFKIGR